MARVWDLLTSPALALYMQDLNYKNQNPLFFEKYFPARKQAGLNLSWFKGYNHLAMDLQPGSFDAAIPIRDRQDFEKNETQMPLFREEMALTELDRQNILSMQEVLNLEDGSRNSELAKELLNKIFDDRTELYKGAKSAQEFMRTKLVVEGKFTIENREHAGDIIKHTYNFDPNGTWAANHITTATVAWSDLTNSDPLGDMEKQIQKALENGVVIQEIVMGATTFGYMVQNHNIKLNMNGNNVATLVSFSKKATQEYVESYLGVPIKIDQQNHKNTKGVAEFYYPQDNNVTFIGAETLGNTVFGTTPEEASGYSVPGYDTSLVDTGISITVFTQANPNLTKITRVSEIVLPSFQNMDAVYNLKW